MFVDAPLVVRNQTGQRLCETQVGQRYGRWRVSANTTNIHSPRLAGVQFLRLAALVGWQYSDGSSRPPSAGRFVSETYPYATLVGAAELGYDTERPVLDELGLPRRLGLDQRRVARTNYHRHGILSLALSRSCSGARLCSRVVALSAPS